jgi:thiol-disulfide isomerase/thioredoxin
VVSGLISLFLAVLATAMPSRPIQVRDVDGKPWSLLAPAGNQLDLVLFLATDCPISNRYLPEIKRTCEEYSSRGVRCFAVYPDGNDAEVIRHRQEYGVPPTIPSIVDRDRVLVRTVAPKVTPEAAIYSQAGRLYRGRIDDFYIDVGRSRREATRHDVRLALDAALRGKAIEPSETEAIGCTIVEH